MKLPVEVVEVLASDDVYGGQSPMSQAFPLLTVSDSGHPHVYLLSTAQVDVVDQAVLVSVSGRTTRHNLRARELATLVVVEGVTAHYLESRVESVVEVHGRDGFALSVNKVRRDSAGVELVPLGFRFAPELAVEERWETDEIVLAAIRDAIRSTLAGPAGPDA